MSKLLNFSFVFLIFSSCLLRAESKFLEEWWDGKGAAGDLFGVHPTLEHGQLALEIRDLFGERGVHVLHPILKDLEWPTLGQ
jgi:hypothetical protein